MTISVPPPLFKRERVMPEQKETHRGFEIVIDDTEVTPESITIGDTTVEVTVGDDGRYSTRYMPYSDYDSLMALAKHVIDKAPDFETD